AAGADDVLSDAVVCNSLSEAVSDCALVIGTSARERRIPWMVQTPRDCAARILDTLQSEEVAVLFGRESSGLTNAELELCNAMLQIPANPEFSSLNIASAIQILCYELMLGILDGETTEGEEPETPLATAGQMQLFYEHLEACMQQIGFLDPAKPRQLMRRLRRFFNRSQPDQDELNLLRGMLTAMQKAAGSVDTGNSRD
ncbi:MAG: RNA methyltransferase, partial [Gammaproteobacteria bacterium]|nr:RNA methyltransferase [Gammaproteobacteria bacterium]